MRDTLDQMMARLPYHTSGRKWSGFQCTGLPGRGRLPWRGERPGQQGNQQQVQNRRVKAPAHLRRTGPRNRRDKGKMGWLPGVIHPGFRPGTGAAKWVCPDGPTGRWREPSTGLTGARLFRPERHQESSPLTHPGCSTADRSSSAAPNQAWRMSSVPPSPSHPPFGLPSHGPGASRRARRYVMYPHSPAKTHLNRDRASQGGQISARGN